MDKSEIIAELVASKQQEDTLENELLARIRENTLLKQRLQDLTDFAEELDVKMPGQWSLEEQSTALRLVLKSIREDVRGELTSELNLDGKDLPNLMRQVFAENEQRGREVRRLERKVAELIKYVQKLQTKKDQTDHKVGHKDIEYEDISLHGNGVAVHGSSDEEVFASMSELHSDTNLECKVVKTVDQIVTSSKAKLKKNLQCPLSKEAEINAPISEKPFSQMTDEEFCDLQIRLLEAGHELSKEDLLVVEEVTAKYSEANIVEKKLPTVEKQQPCQVILTGLSWGPTPGAVVRHVRDYEGVTKIKIDGDIAEIHFINIEMAEQFRGQGENHIIDGVSIPLGELFVEENLGIRDVEDANEELKSSVAVPIRRRGVM